MNGSGITYEDVIAANVRNQKNKEIENLKQEAERLNNIINKAIEYIGNHFLYHYGSDKRPIVFEDNYIQEIVDILKGSEKE